ncbi:MAG: signal recognition particle-docking protein FtsY [Archaeoglobales archaeon]|nr:MAG: signal recognition particle-docking protein FtsY [Archaeoglobales archaeon]
MFKSLKEKLSSFKRKIDEKFKSESKSESKVKKVGLKDKIVTLVKDREIIIDEKGVSEILEDLEIILLESDVAFEVVEEISRNLREKLVGRRRKIGEKLSEIVINELKFTILDILEKNKFDFDEFVELKLKEKRPINVVFVGVNGTGKTTTIAKVAKRLMDFGYSVVLAAGDTFRAGAIEQLEEHGRRLGVRVVKHKMGGDPAAVIYDAIRHAESKGIDFVLSDTAGRMHTKKNLIDQLAKIKRVTKPDLTIFVDESIAGNDAVERARMFNEVVGIDGTILTKIDADPKGGTAISISYVTEKPILFLGTGQRYEDLVKFDSNWLVERIFGGI